MRKIEETLDDFYSIYYKVEKVNVDNTIRCMTANEMKIIDSIGNKKTTVKVLADRMDVKACTISLALDKLEKKQFIAKVKDEVDKRIVYIKLTKKGQLALKYHGNFNTTLFKQITENVDKKDLQVFSDVLRKITSNLYNIKKSIEPVDIFNFRVDDRLVIIDIKINDDNKLKYLVADGLNIGKKVKILEKDKDSILLKIDNKKRKINRDDDVLILCKKGR
ncbi:MarR family winged helix-turn-helix transcriptional regulator [Sneathia vaginalis]|uniref:MarR family winged helix-turn-helix transcriptional regulator n=1 Tax=Sneathia vaginalis TaxID=187101 RepID=UPI002889C83F|nr:winged helix DNA-binding protein [Sneathia vaginalis]